LRVISPIRILTVRKNIAERVGCTSKYKKRGLLKEDKGDEKRIRKDTTQ
jgi:hypothetical protein